MSDPGTTDFEGEGTYAAGDVDLADAMPEDEAAAPVREWIRTAQGVVRHNAETRPYTTLLVAGAIGYVLAAGVPTSVSRMALNAGGRMVMGRIVQSLLSEQS
jgi:hypothetical protein